MGVTVGCAQCHDHKYHPYTARDFYTLNAFFADIDDEKHMGQAGFGGASVSPYQPAGVYRHLNFPQRGYKADADARQWRWGLYVHWQRMFLHPQLLAKLDGQEMPASS